MGAGNSKPRRVIQLQAAGEEGNEVKVDYDVDATASMIEEGPTKENPMVFVICIAGKFRSGKSFLMNLLKTYLDYYCKHGTDDGWKESGRIKIEGGTWAGGEDSVTHGIWIYMYPELVDNRAIILMDCQGSKDTTHSNPTLDNLIQFVGLQLSDVHILNLEKHLDCDDLYHLNMCVGHADDSSDSLFQRQVFLIRDWQNQAKPKQLDKLMRDTMSNSVKRSCLGIYRAFMKVETVGLPYPGGGVVGKSEEHKVAIGDLDPGFMREAKELFHRLIMEYPEEARYTCEDFLYQFKKVSRIPIQTVSTPEQALTAVVVKRKFDEAEKYFKTEMEELEKSRAGLTDTEVEERITAVHKQSMTMFKESRKVKSCSDSQLVHGYLETLDKQYSDVIAYARIVLEKDRFMREKEAEKDTFMREKEAEKDRFMREKEASAKEVEEYAKKAGEDRKMAEKSQKLLEESKRMAMEQKTLANEKDNELERERRKREELEAKLEKLEHENELKDQSKALRVASPGAAAVGNESELNDGVLKVCKTHAEALNVLFTRVKEDQEAELAAERKARRGEKVCVIS